MEAKYDGPYFLVKIGHRTLPDVLMYRQHDGKLRFSYKESCIIVEDTKDANTWLWLIAQIVEGACSTTI